MTMKFAFYGRVSTEDQQDPTSSKQWQLVRAESCLPKGAKIVREYFDVGQSRSLPWKRRPEASRLLADLKDPGRGWSTVVIGEPSRAFSGIEFGLIFPLLTDRDIELWCPEVGGRVDPGSEAAEQIMLMFGGMSKGERNRIKMRVRTAMEQQAKHGTFLGGRPPYGYRMADAGPHPNPGKAARRAAPAPPRARPGDRSDPGAHLRGVCSRLRRGRHRRRPQPRPHPLPQRARPGAQPAPGRCAGCLGEVGH